MNYLEMMLSMAGAGAAFSYFNQRGMADVLRLFHWLRTKLNKRISEKDELAKMKRELEIELSLARACRRELHEMARQDVNVAGPWKRGWK